MTALLRLEAVNFRSLRGVTVDLSALNVLVGPNQAGKSNFLDLIEFLGDAAREDLPAAIDSRGGYDRLRFRGNSTGSVRIAVTANVTSYSSVTAPDEYELTFFTRRAHKARPQPAALFRTESLTFKRRQGRGRRLNVNGSRVEFVSFSSDESTLERELPLRRDSLALSTLRKLPPEDGGEEIDRIASLFTTFRIFNVDVDAARRPSRANQSQLLPDASNLAAALAALSQREPRAFAALVADARELIPGLQDIEILEIGGSGPGFVIQLVEAGMRDATVLADASFGAIRLLALLTLLYDPAPPQLTCVEEIDHGLHPHMFDLLVDRLREASTKTQFLIATHSPALVNRLDPSELLVCERASDGSTRLPAVDPQLISEKAAAVDGRLGLGEMWFSGSLGGVP